MLPDFQTEHALKKAEEVLARVQKEVYVHERHEIHFTVSMGYRPTWRRRTRSKPWIKRADLALYYSKNTGRNRFTLAAEPLIRAA